MVPVLPKDDELAERGVYRGYWKGPNGERVLVAVMSDKRLLGDGYVILPPDVLLIDAVRELRTQLDELDPIDLAGQMRLRLVRDPLLPGHYRKRGPITMESLAKRYEAILATAAARRATQAAAVRARNAAPLDAAEAQDLAERWGGA